MTQNGATDNPFTFHGAWGVMQEGATSLYYMRARYYDSASQRFLSRDPAGSLDPLRIDPYQFALNNPVSFRDPSGASAEPGNPTRHTGATVNSIAETLPNPTNLNPPGPAAPTATSSLLGASPQAPDVAGLLLSVFLFEANPDQVSSEVIVKIFGKDIRREFWHGPEPEPEPFSGVYVPEPDVQELTPDLRLSDLVM